MIRYQAKTVVDALLGSCSDADAPRFADQLFLHYQDPHAVEADTAFALLDTALNVPMGRVSPENLTRLSQFAAWWLTSGDEPQKAAAMRLFRRLLSSLAPGSPELSFVTHVMDDMTSESSIPLLFLQAQLGGKLGLDASVHWAILNQSEAVSRVFLDNLKTATPWVLKAVGVEYLLNQVEQGNHANVLHIATHFSNLIKVSENVIVRRMAGAALLSIAPVLSPDHRNEIAVELSKALETGQAEISQYIPEYLGRFALWLTPRELDELLDQMLTLLSFPNTGVAAAALSTVGSMLEHYAVYGGRFGEDGAVLDARRRRMAGLLLKGLSSYREQVRQECLHILGRLFSSQALAYEDKTDLFTLMAKKILFLIGEQEEQELTFFYTAAALSHIYRFIIHHHIESGPFRF